MPEAAADVAVGAKSFEGDRQFVSALHRGLEVLRCFQPGDDGLGVGTSVGDLCVYIEAIPSK